MKEIGTEPCCHKTDAQSQACGDGALGHMEDGGKGHHGKCYIGCIIQEGLQKAVFNLFANQCQGQNAYAKGHACHNQNVNKRIVCHESSFSTGTGNSAAAIPAMITVNKIVRVPSERVENGGSTEAR